MKKVLGFAIGIGLVGAAWGLLTSKLGWLSFPGFMGWTLFFYGGGNIKAVKEGLPCMFLGVGLAYLSTLLDFSFLGTDLGIFVSGFLLSFVMTYSQNIKLFNVVPAIFFGSIMYFSTGSLFYSTVVSTMGVAIMGPVSVILGNFLDNKIYGDDKPLIQ